MAKTFVIIGLVLSLLATIFLYFGSKDLLWDVQTYNGKSDLEKRFYGNQAKEMKTGFAFLFAGFLCQLVGVVM